MRGKWALAALPVALVVGCGSSSGGGAPASGPAVSQDGPTVDQPASLDDAGKAACSYFTLAKAKAGASGGEAGTGDLEHGLQTAQESATAHFADDLSGAVTGGTPEDKARQLLAVCNRYGY